MVSVNDRGLGGSELISAADIDLAAGAGIEFFNFDVGGQIVDQSGDEDGAADQDEANAHDEKVFHGLEEWVLWTAEWRGASYGVEIDVESDVLVGERVRLGVSVRREWGVGR